MNERRCRTYGSAMNFLSKEVGNSGVDPGDADDIQLQVAETGSKEEAEFIFFVAVNLKKGEPVQNTSLVKVPRKNLKQDDLACIEEMGVYSKSAPDFDFSFDDEKETGPKKPSRKKGGRKER